MYKNSVLFFIAVQHSSKVEPSVSIDLVKSIYKLNTKVRSEPS